MENDGVRERLNQAKWHVARYDSLQATTASRASTVLSANALVLAGITVLISQGLRKDAVSFTTATILVLISSAMALIFVALSVVVAAQGLLALTALAS